ncbi:DUF6993 domain-containing protein [Microbacterium sp. LMI1-1-1.1]|uniref:DUF6993 domain-containing protein n=1 Tax=Microbacterium sp. LMI1-1-1.1 TaxID=3135223 RepID=UPI003466FA5A
MTTTTARLAGALAIAATLALSGCAPEPAPVPTPTSSSEASTAPTESAAPAAPALVPGGSAADNLPFFTQIVASVWAGDGRSAGRSYIDALTAGGFDKAAMQVTEDTSTVGNAAESIQFSVRWGEDCLIGQVGPATGDPVTTVVGGLPSGGCLMGQTRPIDW